jgi:hypothetical protein
VLSDQFAFFASSPLAAGSSVCSLIVVMSSFLKYPFLLYFIIEEELALVYVIIVSLPVTASESIMWHSEARA